ncbi:MerR family regulatory protein [Methylobrevis pamukkalensis]|uniref:MerR family regulatory protein n=1 Tax=Methylobrevis pamukkalensis TaxID=1439726 RepID=A0A1E3H4U2_9HYPH|nr:MerR family regulatory protein [Methylobrevis pamukkalensis]
MEKRPDAFRTISEVAEELDLPQHVLRFWETRFSQIRPLKRGGGRRYYRPEDLDLLRGIRHLLYGQGFTIKGVQRILKEQGVHYVMEIWRNPGAILPAGAADTDEAEDAGAMKSPSAPKGQGAAPAVPERPAFSERRMSFPSADDDEPEAQTYPERPDSDRPSSERDLLGYAKPSRVDTGRGAPAAAAQPVSVPSPADDEPLPAGILPDDAPVRSGFRFMDRLRGGGSGNVGSEPQGSGALSRDDIRRLQSTLFELLECKRVLDQTR